MTIALIPAFLLGASSLVPPAGGAPAAERPVVEVKAIEPRVTRPQAPPAAAPTPAKDAGPGVSLDDFLAERGRRWQEITARQIAKIRSLIASTPEDDPQRPDFLFRAGELYAENRRFYFNHAHALDQKIFDAPPAARPALEQERRRLETQEQAWLLEAVKAYAAATHYPRYQRMDEVLFRLADLLRAVKKDDQARELLLRLLKDYPTSKYVPDAYLAFAELYFDRGEMNAALRFYEKVAQFPASSVHAYAIYKKGWCLMNLGDFKGALETFVGVVRMAAAPAKTAAPQLAALGRQARRDVVIAYARVGRPGKAWELFRRVGGDGAEAMMETLAERYWEQGQAPDSTQIYRRLMAEVAGSPRVCGWQNKVLRNALSSGDKRVQTQELERLGAVVDHAPPSKQGEAAECRNALHDAARELALIWHREAQRTQNADTYQLAERAYRLFFDHFPDDKDSYEMSYYAGELLWAMKRWKDAAEQYTRVVERDAHGKYLRDAAYAAVLAWEKTLAADTGKREPPPGAKLAPRPIPGDQQKMIAAFHTYARHVPDAPERPAMIYREAYIDYDHDHLAEAEALFLEVVERFPTHQLAPFAANLYLDALNREGRIEDVVAGARRFLDTPALARDAELVAQLIAILSDGYDLEARAYEKRGDAKECGRSFLAAAEALPAHRKHAERLWNAGQCFQNAHLVGQAVKAWLALIDGHPADVLASRALYRVAAGYQQLAYYAKAASYYEDFAKEFPGEAQAPAALGNATVFREGLDEGDKAIADMNAFVTFYGARRPQDAAGAYFQMAEVYESQRRHDDLRAHLRAYVDRWGKQGGLDRLVRAHFRLGELAWKESCPRASEDGACLRVERLSSSRGQQLLAVARRRFAKARRTQCGPETKSRIVVLDRSRAPASAAVEHFRTAINLWKAGDAANPITGAGAEDRRAAAAYAVAGAAFYLAEKEYEDLLRVKFPQGLDFSRPSPRDSARRQAAAAHKLDDSKRRFAAYLAEKARLLEKARAQYLDVFGMRQAQWTIAAAARIGQLHQDFAGQLYTAEIPRDLAETDQWGNSPIDLYCGALEDEAGKVEAKAIEALKACLAAATQHSWYNEWSRLCERELNQLEPSQFPLASEIKPDAGFVPMTMTAAGVRSDLN